MAEIDKSDTESKLDNPSGIESKPPVIMSEKSDPKFRLEVIKVLIWPSLIVLGVLWLGNDFKEILKSRTWKVGGVLEVGDRVSNLQSSVQEGLLLQKDFLNKIIADSADSLKVQAFANEALKNIENAQKGVKKEIQNIQQTIPQAVPTESGQSTDQEVNATIPNTAKGWEIEGFTQLLSRSIDPSIQAFTEAEKIWPDYHNVAEIRQLLIKERIHLRHMRAVSGRTCIKKY
jgi:hypothetical protein